MILLGIDPSIRSGTGLAIVDTTPSRPKVLTTACVKLAARELTEWEASRKESDVARRVSDFIHRHTFEAVAIEWPIEHNQARTYRRADGSKGTRLPSSHSQWRLIGRLHERLEPLAPVIQVTPGEAKAAAGLSQKSKRKPVEEVQLITGHRLDKEHKYVREAVADAIAIALAGAKIHELAQQRAG